MTKTIRKATLIVRLWTENDPVGENFWRGTADFIGKGESFQFQSIKDFIVWMEKELLDVENETISNKRSS